MLVDSDRDISCHLLILSNAALNPLNLALEYIWMEFHIRVNISYVYFSIYLVITILSYIRRIDYQTG